MKPKYLKKGFFFTYIFCFLLFLLSPIKISAQNKEISVEVTVDPTVVIPNQPTEIILEVFSSPGTPLPKAYVVITAGGGLFLDSHGTSIDGKTDANGIYISRWKCKQCTSSYKFTIEVLKPGMQGWRGEARVEVTSPPSPKKGGEIYANIHFDPPIASEGQPILITIETFSQEGNPVNDAQVNINTGGGLFTDNGSSSVEGLTNINGFFETPWKCLQCEEKYIFKVEINKKDWQGWSGEARILTGEQPVPLHKGDININATIQPSTVSQGQNTILRIEAISDRGDPVPDAEVRIKSGGGNFVDFPETIVKGKTDEFGTFIVKWNCTTCASSYVFNIEVNKPGFNEGMADISVKIK